MAAMWLCHVSTTVAVHSFWLLPANGGTTTGDEVCAGEREGRGVWCAHPGGRRRTEATGGEERAAAMFGLMARARGSLEDGGGGEDAEAVTAAQSAAEGASAKALRR